jgi:hypothetical protein
VTSTGTFGGYSHKTPTNDVLYVNAIERFRIAAGWTKLELIENTLI